YFSFSIIYFGNRFLSVKLHFQHFRIKADIDSLSHGFFSEYHIKVGPGNLPGPIPSLAMFLAEIKFPYLVTFDKSCTEFLLKTCFHRSFKQPCLGKIIHTLRNKTFTNRTPGKTGFLDYESFNST